MSTLAHFDSINCSKITLIVVVYSLDRRNITSTSDFNLVPPVFYNGCSYGVSESMMVQK